MKMTLVLDTDDPQGLDDAYKIAQMLHKKHARTTFDPAFTGKKVAFGKIQLIKFIRTFARECEEKLKDSAITEEAPALSSLRNTKRFVDARWDGLDET